MKITETIERDCCQPQDVKRYRGIDADRFKHRNPFFCTHCGQLWVGDTCMDAAGGTEHIHVKVRPGEQVK